MALTAADIEILFEAVATDDPIVTADVTTPLGTLKVMAQVAWTGRRLELDGMHIQPGQDGERHRRAAIVWNPSRRAGEDRCRRNRR